MAADPADGLPEMLWIVEIHPPLLRSYT